MSDPRDEKQKGPGDEPPQPGWTYLIQVEGFQCAATYGEDGRWRNTYTRELINGEVLILRKLW